MLRFGTVGSIGVVVDTVVLYAALALGAGLYGGRVLSYLTAATGNWLLNRIWTFRTAAHAPAGRQWLRFLAVNGLGFFINYGVYVLLVSNIPAFTTRPVLGVVAGALAGMVVNFVLNRRLVFQGKAKLEANKP
ncbi:GtrA family protein [Teichococcus vastitatis]|uniref:GtrA family protein n=2 Tax=Teichococcus vastitatis TaxID=2307076 RepID=A0ABS9W2K7_9PROT|nr:GtrA family protein [Pseudoroseomonas vastitatis]MCI0753175.1 GtrA family protein [Pseudoroseomonas vastitatis]